MGIYGLLGEKLSHSYSPLIHSILGDYPYALTELSPEAAREFLQRHEFDAYNVTIPYKKLAYECCDILSDEAKAIGSVNTLVVGKDGRLYGYNTDAFGFAYMLELLGADPAGKKCIVLGNGGASVTVQYVLNKMGASSVTVISRRGPITYDMLDSFYDAQIIVNATPVGMYPQNGEGLIDLDSFTCCEAVIDLIYNPCKTRLLLDAEKLGIPCINGLSMLVAQAKRAYELFFDTRRDNGIISEAVKRISADTLNITLVGMPGCGKSTVGRLISALTGRELLDTDELICKKTGRTPADIIRSEGEHKFRKIESLVLREVSKLSGKIIATGGGIVTVEENFDPLRENSTVFYIQRDTEELATEDRPLSANGGLAALYEKRHPLYKQVSDHTVVSRDAEQTARRILELSGINV